MKTKVECSSKQGGCGTGPYNCSNDESNAMGKNNITQAKRNYEKLQKIDYSLVDLRLDRKKIKGHKVSKVRDETLKFLALAAANKGRAYAPSKITDEWWHQAILTTRTYEEMCKVLGTFIHHNPSDFKKATIKSDEKAFNQFVEDYRPAFGKIHQKIWGLGKAAANDCSSHNCTCSGCKSSCKQS